MNREVKVKNGHGPGQAPGVKNGHQASLTRKAGARVDKSETKTDTYHVKLMLIISLLGWPIGYTFNAGFTKFDASERTFWMMTGGFFALLCISIFAVVASKVRDWLFFGLTVFAFSSVIDGIITLEFLGYIQGFMSEYLKMGEPYLFSSWGSAICLFDAIGFFPMYFLIVYYLSNGRSWRSVGLYWAAGILNSMFVLLNGILLGKHPATFCTFLNIPYVVFPIIILFRIFKTEKRSTWHTQIKTNAFTLLWDFALVLGFVFSFWVIVSKALVVTDTRTWLSLVDISTEKAIPLLDPAPFASLQVSVLFFYVLPMIMISIYHLLSKEKPHYLWEITVIQCGLLAEAQFSYILYSLDHTTPEQYRVDWTNQMFWICNLLILIVPHVLLLRLYLHRGPSALSNAIIGSASPNKRK